MNTDNEQLINTLSCVLEQSLVEWRTCVSARPEMMEYDGPVKLKIRQQKLELARCCMRR